MADEVNDRSTVKWTSLMLSEHVELLNEWYESKEELEKPILSENKIEELQHTIQEPIEFRRYYVFHFMKTNGY